MPNGSTSEFLDEIIRSRIAVRMIAEQHIAISHGLRTPSSTTREVGIVNTKTSPREMINMCARFVGELSDATLGASPRLVLEGDVDATFPYVCAATLGCLADANTATCQYIWNTSSLVLVVSVVAQPSYTDKTSEVLKNSYRATVEHHHHAPHLPPVVVTVAHSLLASSPSRPAYLSLRIRDQGGGVSPNNLKRIFSYAFTTAGTSDEIHDDAGPYAAQHVGGAAALGGETREGNLFGEITGKGLQTGLGSIAGLGYG